ncbi:MAG TPA: PAS domain S-box protein, partial [Candidatus Limnocylindrales bacterium]
MIAPGEPTTPPDRESRFRALVESIPGAVYRRGAEWPWHFELVSDGIEAIAGYRASDLVRPGALPDALLPMPDDLPVVTDAVRGSVSTGQPYDIEYRVHHADGTMLWVHDRGRPECDAGGGVTWIDGVIFDVTERKRAERVLVEQRARLIALMDNIPDHIYFKDVDSRFTMISRAMATSFGLSDPSQSVGKTDFDFFLEEQARPALEDEREIMRSGRPVVSLEERETWPDGRETWASTTKLVRTDGEGNVVGTFGISRDITERKRADQELRETNAALEEAMGRAVKLAAEADTANQAKSEFLANMSHEIRTPMNGVIGMIGLLLDTELDDEQRHYAETVRASGESLLALLNDILDFSKIEAGSVELEMLDFDMRALLDDFAAMPAMRAHEKGLEFICAVAPDVPAHLSGDPGRLRQVLLNLAGNALKFTGKADDGLKHTRLVLMTSLGRRGDARQMKEIGFAAYLVKPARQSDLFDSLSAVLARAPASHAAQRIVTRHAVGNMHRGAVRILLAEDNITNQQVALGVLKKLGLRADAVADGSEAVRSLETIPYDLVLM